MRCLRLAIAAIACLLLAGPAGAEPADDTAAWLNRLHVDDLGQPFTAERVKTATRASFILADMAALKAGDIDKLAAMPMLEIIVINSWRVGDDIGVAIARLRNPRLRDIELSQAPITDVTLAALADHPTLQALKIEHTKITDEGMRDVAKIKNLLSLDIGDTAIDDAGLELLADAPKLKSLNLGEFKRLTRRGWAAIGHMQHLESLTAFGWIDEKLEELAAAPKLHTLFLGDRRFMDAGALQLGKLRHVRELVLRNATITDRSMPAIASLPELETLDLTGTAITDAGLQHLADLPALQLLALDSTRIGDEGLLKLAEIKTLKALYVRGTRVTEDGVRKFKAHLPKVEVFK